MSQIRKHEGKPNPFVVLMRSSVGWDELPLFIRTLASILPLVVTRSRELFVVYRPDIAAFDVFTTISFAVKP